MINGNYFLLNVMALAIGTIIIRGFFIALSSRLNISSRTRELFTYIPAAIFPALIMPAVFFHRGTVELLAGKERFIVLIASLIASFYFRSTLFIVSFGLTLLYLVTY